MHNYNVLLGRTARLAKLINRPGVIHAPLELNHPKKWAEIDFDSVSSASLLWGRRTSAPGPAGWGARPGPARLSRPRPVPAARLESCGSRRLATRAGLPVRQRARSARGGCVSEGSYGVAQVHGASELPEQLSGLVPWSLWCERRKREEARRGGMRDVPDQDDELNFPVRWWDAKGSDASLIRHLPWKITCLSCSN